MHQALQQSGDTHVSRVGFSTQECACSPFIPRRERAPLPQPPTYLQSCLTKLGMEHTQQDTQDICAGSDGAGWRRGNKRLCNMGGGTLPEGAVRSSNPVSCFGEIW